MDTTPGARIRQWREFKGLTLSQVSRDTGIKVTTLSTSEQPGANNPSFDTFSKMLAAYPDLSPDWLLTGAGPMLRDGRVLTPTVAAAPAEVPMRAVPDAAEVGYLKERIKDKDQIIEILREQLDTLRAYLPESLGKLLPDSFAAEPAARPTVGFVQSNVTMTCNGNTYTEARTEASTIWIQARKVA